MKLIRKTKRLIIRPFEPKDFKAWVQAKYESQTKKNIWDTIENLEKITRKDYVKNLKVWKSNIEKDFFYHLGIFLKDGTLIGFVNLMDVSRNIFQNAYIGYRIYSKFWKQGYGKEAVAAAIDIGFKDLNLHRIEAGIDPKNKASIALAKTLKFRKEGLSKKRLLLQGEWKDFSIYALTTEDVGRKWKAKRC